MKIKRRIEIKCNNSAKNIIVMRNRCNDSSESLDVTKAEYKIKVIYLNLLKSKF